MANYFNTLNLRNQLAQLGKCRFMARDEFADGASFLNTNPITVTCPTSGHRRRIASASSAVNALRRRRLSGNPPTKNPGRNDRM